MSSLYSSELRDLLHRRLKQTFALGAAATACMLVLWLINGVPWLKDLGLFTLLILVTTPALLLHRKQDFSIESLRNLELLLIGLGFLGMTYVCLYRIHNITSAPDLTVPLELGRSAAFPGGFFILADGSLFTRSSFAIPANAIILNWTLFGVAYAVLIPNTWRRCSIVMAFIVSAALCCVAYLLWRVPALRQFAPRMIFYTGFMVSLFAAISIYGSHKLEVLRTQAVAAQEVGQYRLICERGRVQDVVKLLDFGLVQVAGERGFLPAAPASATGAATARDSSEVKLTLAGHILGTPAYLSPEQARNHLADARSDIYSTGAVAYFLLTGSPPFVRPTVSQLLEAHEQELPRPLLDLSIPIDRDLAPVRSPVR